MTKLARLIAAVTSRDHTGPAKDFKPGAEVILTSAFAHVLAEPDDNTQTLMLKVDAASIADRFTGVEKIVVDVMAERDRQDQQWGGPGHDDTHSGDQWLGYIAHQLARAHHETMSDDATQVVDPEGYRQRLVKAAALAFAAIESHDRLQAMSEAFEGAEANLRSQGIPT